MYIPSEYVIVSLAAATFDLVVAALIILEMRRLRVGFSWLGSLAVAFFVLHAFNRIDDPDLPFGYSANIEVVIDVLLVAVLATLVVNARRLTRSIVGTMADARYRKLEYERARRDYTQVVRHRIMNPLTIIRAAAMTLDGGAVHDATLRRQLSQAIIEASEVLEQVSLQPERRGEEEHELDAVPHTRRSDWGEAFRTE